MLYSNRQYKVALVSGNCRSGPWLDTADLKRLQEADPTGAEDEFIYAMNDIVDTILDLQAGQSMYFQSNRDDPNSKGIILRIQ